LNYIGSKYRLSPFITEAIETHAGPLKGKTFAEIFGGTGAIARQLKTKVKKVIVNDTEPYAFALLKHYIGNHQPVDADSCLDSLNKLKGDEGFIFKHYCLGGGTGRNYFTDTNGKKIDAIRKKIGAWRKKKTIDEHTYYCLLASLIEAADKVANTASVYGAYLKQIKKSAQQEMKLVSMPYELTKNAHEVYSEDANALVRKISGDVLYLDPPYNARQYGANYHLLNTIALYDDFEPQGKTGLRPGYFKSDYCRSSTVANAFEDLLGNAQFKHIFISYNNEGLLPEAALKRICEKFGKYDLIRRKYQRFKADKTEARNHTATETEEHLHVLVKNG
jgi:adenine-specific DNA-methyltransferase